MKRLSLILLLLSVNLSPIWCENSDLKMEEFLSSYKLDEGAAQPMEPKENPQSADLEEFNEAVSRLLLPRSCNKEEWVLCVVVLGECVYECCSGYCVLTPSCAWCMGELYERCKDCFVF